MARFSVVKTGQGQSESIPLDLAHLDAQTLGDPGLREEVLRLYANMSGVYLARIQSAANPIEQLSHLNTLKSAAAGVGATQVFESTRIVEDAMRRGQAVEPAQLLAIATAVAECQDYIRSLIESE